MCITHDLDLAPSLKVIFRVASNHNGSKGRQQLWCNRKVQEGKDSLFDKMTDACAASLAVLSVELPSCACVRPPFLLFAVLTVAAGLGLGKRGWPMSNYCFSMDMGNGRKPQKPCVKRVNETSTKRGV